jgi:hypothetical protein
MTGLSVILGILLIVLMLRKNKPLSGWGLMLWLVVIAFFYAATTAMIVSNASESTIVAGLIGRAVGAYVLLLLFVAVGHVIRGRRAKPTA